MGGMAVRMQTPEGKFLSTVQVDEEGRIVIPEEVREMFEIRPGEKLLFLADRKKGMALQRGAL